MSGLSTYLFQILTLVILPLCAFVGIGWGGYLLLRTQEDGSRILTRDTSAMLCLLIPGLLNLALFYSLAIHMHKSLGKFPEVIGYRGFSSALKSHADWAIGYFGYLFIFTFLIWPVLFVLFTKVKALSRFTGQVAAVGISFWLSFALTFLAPPEFLYWWWD